MNKLQIGDKVKLGDFTLEITVISGFGGVPYYGVHYPKAGNFFGSAGWIPVEILDATALAIGPLE